MNRLISALETLGIAGSRIQPFFVYETGQSFLCASTGRDVLDLWFLLFQVSTRSNYLPVILGDQEALADHQDRLQNLQVAQDTDVIAVTPIIDASMSVEPEDWFRNRAHAFDRRYGLSLATDEPTIIPTPSPQPHMNRSFEWKLASDPYTFEPNTFTIPTRLIYPDVSQDGQEISIEPADSVFIGLFPTQTVWHIPAYLANDGPNDAPSTAEHMIVWRWWYQRHLAVIVGNALNKIEGWSVPPDKLSARRLNWEMMVYCLDYDTDRIDTSERAAKVLQFAWS